MQPITPYLTIKGADKALEFYQEAFGATDIFRHPGEDGRLFHARMTINGGTVMMSDECATSARNSASRPRVHVPLAAIVTQLVDSEPPRHRTRMTATPVLAGPMNTLACAVPFAGTLTSTWASP